MDENMSDDSARDENLENHNENAKRFKTDNDGDNSKSSSSFGLFNNSTSSPEQSSTSGLFKHRSKEARRRNYRSHSGDNNESSNSASEGDQRNENDLEVIELAESNVTNDNIAEPPSVDSSNSVVINDSESDVQDNDDDDEDDDEDDDDEVPPVLNKEKPKHNWFVVKEVLNRQIGSSAKKQSSQLFQQRCYGSLRNVQRLELMYKLEEHKGCVNSLNFHPDGSLLASGSDDLKVVIWDWKIGKCLLKYNTKHRSNVFQSKFLNLNGDLHIATCARDGQVRYAQVSRQEGLRENRKLGCHKAPCHKLVVLPEQPHVILSAGEDAVVLSHDVRKSLAEKLVTVQDDDRDIALYSIHANPLRTHEFCVGGRDDVVRVYDQRKSKSPLAFYHPSSKVSRYDYQGPHVTCAVYNHDGTEILSSYIDGHIYLFDVNEPPGTYKHMYQGHKNGATIKGVSFFGPKSEYVVSGSDCGHIYFWDRNTEAIVQFLLGDDNGVVNCLEPHPQLPFICTSGLDWDVKVWVPSCEEDPKMEKLAETIKRNNSRINWGTDVNESQMLWMLWRHLRRSRIGENGSSDLLSSHFMLSSSSDSSSDSDINDDDDDDDLDGPGCSAS